jgi:hypothetical protein
MSSSPYHVRALWTAIATATIPIIGVRAAADLRHIVSDEDVETVPGQIAAVLAEDATPVVLVLDNLHEITSWSGPRGGRPVSGWSPCSCGATQIPPGSSMRSPTHARSATSTDGRRSGTADTPCPSTPSDTPYAAAYGHWPQRSSASTSPPR